MHAGCWCRRYGVSMSKSFSFRGQLGIGRMGVETVISVLQKRGYICKDLQDDMEMQHRGVDLYVEGLGYLEVKTDSHSPENFFLELDVKGKPGAIDRSTADYFCILFPNYQVIYLLPRAELQQWLRENYSWIKDEHPDWIRTIHSTAGKSRWSARGVIVPRTVLMKQVSVATLKWKEET